MGAGSLLACMTLRPCYPLLCRYGSQLRSRPVAHLVTATDLEGGNADCSMLLVHAGAFSWMMDSVDKLMDGHSRGREGREGRAEGTMGAEGIEGKEGTAGIAQQGTEGTAADRAASLLPDQRTGSTALQPIHYVWAWNAGVRAGIRDCSGRACPPSKVAGSSLAGGPTHAPHRPVHRWFSRGGGWYVADCTFNLRCSGSTWRGGGGVEPCPVYGRAPPRLRGGEPAAVAARRVQDRGRAYGAARGRGRRQVGPRRAAGRCWCERGLGRDSTLMYRGDRDILRTHAAHSVASPRLVLTRIY